jgi:hypothetical protein
MIETCHFGHRLPVGSMIGASRGCRGCRAIALTVRSTDPETFKRWESAWQQKQQARPLATVELPREPLDWDAA